MNFHQKLWLYCNLAWLGILALYVTLHFIMPTDFFIIALGLFGIIMMMNYWRYVSDVIFDKHIEKMDRKIGYYNAKIETSKLLKHHITHYSNQILIQKDKVLKEKAKNMRESLEYFAEKL